MGKRTVTLKTAIEGNLVTFKTDDGKFTIKCDPELLSDSMRTRYMLAGIAHTIRDSGALPAPCTMADKILAMQARWDLTVGGEWESKRVAMTPEEKAARLYADVAAAWVSLRAGRTVGQFPEYVAETLARNTGPGKENLTGADIVAAMAKVPAIAGAIAAAKNKGGVSLEFDDIE